MIRNKGARVWCDRCRKPFKAALKERNIPDGVIQEFACPHCKTVYPVCRISREGIAIRERLGMVTNQNIRRKLLADLQKEIIRL